MNSELLIKIQTDDEAKAAKASEDLRINEAKVADDLSKKAALKDIYDAMSDAEKKEHNAQIIADRKKKEAAKKAAKKANQKALAEEMMNLTEE